MTFDITTSHTTLVVVTGTSKEEAMANAIHRLNENKEIGMHMLPPPPNANDVVDYINGRNIQLTYKGTIPIEVVTRWENSLTEVQTRIVSRLFTDDRLEYKPKLDRWMCGNMCVSARTITSMCRKGVLKCVSLSEKERAVQIALGTIEQDAIQLVLDPTSKVLMKSTKFKPLIQTLNENLS